MRSVFRRPYTAAVRLYHCCDTGKAGGPCRQGRSNLPEYRILIDAVPVLMMVDNLRQLIDLELLILGGMGIVEGPLLEWDISADKVDQPAVLLIKLVAQLNKIKYNVHEHCLIFGLVKVWSLTLYQKGRSMLTKYR